MKQAVRLVVNGQARAGAAEPRTSLADFLRDDLDLTGTHVGCEHGVCGACTVLLEGEPVRACLMLAVQAEGRSVTTIEGLAGARAGLGGPDSGLAGAGSDLGRQDTGRGRARVSRGRSRIAGTAPGRGRGRRRASPNPAGIHG